VPEAFHQCLNLRNSKVIKYKDIDVYQTLL